MDSLRRKPAPPAVLAPKPLSAPPKRVFHQEGFPNEQERRELSLERTPLYSDTTTPIKQDLGRPRSKKSVLLIILFSIGFFILALVGFLVFKGFLTAEKIQVRGNTISAPTLTQKLKTLQAAFLPGELTPLKGEERGRINILLLGKAGAGLPGENLTDTIILASINTRTKKVALISLPRDLYIESRTSNNSGKINTFYQRDLRRNEEPLEIIKDAVTTITGEPIDYFLVMDFEGFEQVVDALGGITVEVPKDFYDPRYPGKNYSYEIFELKKGWQRLDGSTALKYVRERHDDPEGDFGRAKRQQQVLQAIKNKASSPGTYLNFFRINKLFESVAQNVETDITLPEMQSLYELSKILDTQNISNQVVDAWKPESLLRVDHHVLGGTRTFTLVPRTGNWEETRDLAKNIFELDVLNQRKIAIQKEEARVAILDSGSTLQSADKLARYIERELGMIATVEYAPKLNAYETPAMLVSRSALTKPYSFDELLKRLPLSKGTEVPGGTLSDEGLEADFILIMDKKLAQSFQNADEYYNQETATAGDFSTDLTGNE